MTQSPPRQATGPLPPCHVYADFLAPAEQVRMLDWTLANEANFSVSKIFGDVVNPRRVSRSLTDLGPMREVLKARARALLPGAFADTGTQPFEVASFELELVAYGDGACFAPHSDMPIGPRRRALGEERRGSVNRLLSGVYYFHREPKGFTGGALFLHRFGSDGGPGDRVEIAPVQNSFVLFPSWVIHEVARVDCPTNDFAEHRFAVNIWLHRAASPDQDS